MKKRGITVLPEKRQEYNGLIMKKKIIRKDLGRLVDMVEIARLISNSKDDFSAIVAKGQASIEKQITELRKEIRDMDQRLILAKWDLSKKLDGTNVRVDDLTLNRGKYDEIFDLRKRIQVLESALKS